MVARPPVVTPLLDRRTPSTCGPAPADASVRPRSWSVSSEDSPYSLATWSGWDRACRANSASTDIRAITSRNGDMAGGPFSVAVLESTDPTAEWASGGCGRYTYVHS